MPTVRCPSCNRALNLPEHADIDTAKCPLCQTAFAVTAQLPPPRPLPARAAPTPVRRREVEPIATPFDFHEEASDPLPRDDRKALYAAANWLKTGSLLAIGHTFLCGCCPFLSVPGLGEDVITVCCFCHLVRIAVSIIIYNGAEAFNRRSSHGWALTSCVLALMLAALSLLFILPILLDLPLQGPARLGMGPNEDQVVAMLAGGLSTLAVIVTFVVGAVKGFLVLRRPAVRRAFGFAVPVTGEEED
jgi:hypothetical protein